MLVKFSPIVILLLRLNATRQRHFLLFLTSHSLEATNMACSCRTAALRIFARSLAQIHAPTAQYARSTWPANRPRLPSRNISTASNYRQARSHTTATNVAVEAEKEQYVIPEDQHNPQPEEGLQSSSPLVPESAREEDRLFSINRRSKNAIRKAARYSKQSDSSLPPESQGQAEGNSNKDQKPRTTVDEQTEQAKKDKRLRDKAEKRTRRIERQAVKAKEAKERADERPEWLKQKETLKKKFPEGWRPPKRLSPDALDGIRVLHQQFPDMYTTAALAKRFEVSPEAIRRILKAKWEPTAEEEERRERRWFNRGVSVWQRYAELGKTPPRRWREAGVQASPWESSRQGERAEEEDMAGESDPETDRRLQAQVKLSKNLV